MAEINLVNDAYISFPLALHRGNAIPLDDSSVVSSVIELQDYAKNSPVSYVGQIISVVDSENKTAAPYIILNEEGDVALLGTSATTPVDIKVDNASISLVDSGNGVNDTISLYDYGKRYYTYNVELDNYAENIVSEDTPWKEDLTLKTFKTFNGEIKLGWYESRDTEISPEVVQSIKEKAVYKILLGNAEDATELTSENNGITIPIFEGGNAPGLVPAATIELEEKPENHYLGADGNWHILPVGDLTDGDVTYETVVEYIDSRLSWEPIVAPATT